MRDGLRGVSRVQYRLFGFPRCRAIRFLCGRGRIVVGSMIRCHSGWLRMLSMRLHTVMRQLVRRSNAVDGCEIAGPL